MTQSFYFLNFAMKLLSIVVRPHVVPRLMDVLKTVPTVELGGVKWIRGYGRQKNYLNEYQGSEYSEAFIPKILLEVAVDDRCVELAIAKAVETARTGRVGDGKIFVFPLEEPGETS